MKKQKAQTPDLPEQVADPLKAQFHKLWGQAHDNDYRKPEWLKMLAMLEAQDWTKNTAVNEELAKRVLLGQKICLKPQTVTVREIEVREVLEAGGKVVDVDPATTVYNVEVIDDGGGGVWMETFSSDREVYVFLRSLRVATCMMGGTMLMGSVWKFGKESTIQSWP